MKFVTYVPHFSLWQPCLHRQRHGWNNPIP